jgi:hypothetical protein
MDWWGNEKGSEIVDRLHCIALLLLLLRLRLCLLLLEVV